MLPASRSHQTGSVELCEIVVKSKDFICKSTLPNDEPMKAVTRKLLCVLLHYCNYKEVSAFCLLIF